MRNSKKSLPASILSNIATAALKTSCLITNLLQFQNFVTKVSMQKVLRFYQAVFSPDHGILGPVFGFSRCRFYPSCSEYTACVIRQYGLFKGIMLSFKRIARCGPWSGGGYDPVA